MPRTRDVEQYEQTSKRIKTIARRQMAAGGTASVSLRAVARELGVTAPALYRYYPRLDDLITALILDAFNGLADALDTAARRPDASLAARVFAVMLAYRAWALEHPTDFQLIYGNPIPGYHAPAERTVPASARSFYAVIGLLDEAYRAGQLEPLPEHAHPPAPVAEAIARIAGRDMPGVAPIVLYVAVSGWGLMHGMVMLELFGHSPPVVGDPEAFYHHEVQTFLRRVGLTPP